MKKGLKLLLSAAFALSIAGCANGSSNDDKTIKIGATAIPHAEILNDVVKDELEKEGYTLEVTEFTDYVTPNTSLEDGDLDANYFQTLAYLKEQNKERKLHLKAVAGIHYEAMALYSENLKSLDDLKDGATIAVPNDGSNESRALALLAKNNLIELNDDTLYTASSITANPHNYKIEELEAANLPNNLPDVDVAVINGNYALEHNLGDSTNVLLTESFTDEEAQPYINYLVVKEGNENTAKAKALKKALQSKKVKNYIKKYKCSSCLYRSYKIRRFKMSVIYLAGGCFWGVQKYFDQFDGIIKTTVGYANGHTENPKYEDVKAEKTGHVETVKIEYDESLRSLNQILDDYYKIIDPTSLNKQGEDEGISYRTGIYYTNESDLEIIQNKTNEIQKKYQEKVVVEIQPLDNFYEAEEYHQKYLEKNPQGYCHIGKCFFG